MVFTNVEMVSPDDAYGFVRRINPERYEDVSVSTGEEVTLNFDVQLQAMLPPSLDEAPKSNSDTTSVSIDQTRS